MEVIVRLQLWAPCCSAIGEETSVEKRDALAEQSSNCHTKNWALEWRSKNGVLWCFQLINHFTEICTLRYIWQSFLLLHNPQLICKNTKMGSMMFYVELKKKKTFSLGCSSQLIHLKPWNDTCTSNCMAMHTSCYISTWHDINSLMQFSTGSLWI